MDHVTENVSLSPFSAITHSGNEDSVGHIQNWSKYFSLHHEKHNVVSDFNDKKKLPTM